MLIVIIGPDGCGKTTIANSLVSELRNRTIKSEHLAMHFEILPQLKDFINPFLKKKIETTHEEGELNAGMKRKINSPLRGAIYVIWYSIDYFLGRFRIRNYKKNNTTVIFARYYYDYYYQRTHSSTPRWLIRLFENLIPKPDFIFTLKRSASNIFEYKPELSIDEIKIQQKKIEDLFSDRNNAFVIDASSGIQETVNQILIKMNLQKK
jgi:thymidylate kinase